MQMHPPNFNDYFLQITMRFEKQKENYYQRKYKNLNNIVSEIGGFTQSLLAIGYLICSRYSQFDLNKHIINEAFNFDAITTDSPKQSKLKNEQFSDKIQSQFLRNNEEIKIESPQEIVVQKTSFHLLSPMNLSNLQTQSRTNLNNKHSIKDLLCKNQQIIDNYNQLSINCDNTQIHGKLDRTRNDNQQIEFQELNISQTPHDLSHVRNFNIKTNNDQSQQNVSDNEKKCLNLLLATPNQPNQVLQTLTNLDNQKERRECTYEVQLIKQQQKYEEQDKKVKESIFMKLMQKARSSMSLSILEYLKYVLFPFGKSKKKVEIMDQSIDKLYQHLDVLQIVKKLLEVDKLKSILLDKDYLTYFSTSLSQLQDIIVQAIPLCLKMIYFININQNCRKLNQHILLIRILQIKSI